jgi:DNA topoisomerase-1
VLEGRYGPYVTDGELNASIPKGTDPAMVSLEDARALLEARRGAAPSPRRARRAAGGSTSGRRRTARAGADTVVSPAPAKKPKTAGRKKTRSVRKRAS